MYMCWCIHVHVHTICVQESVGVLREVYRGWPGSLVVRDLDSYDKFFVFYSRTMAIS